MKSVEPPGLVTSATMLCGGFSRVSSASNSSFGTNTFGSGPIDQAGNWHS